MENGDEEEAQTTVEEIERLSRGTEGPMERIEGVVHPWVSFLILPLFALANAGIVFTSDTLSEASESPVTLGILVALTFGKAVGVLGATWLAVRLGIGSLPTGVNWPQVLGVGMLAGIGFTVAIFVAGIAFDDPALDDRAKIGVFAASLLAGIVGYLFLRFVATRAPTSS